jgi:ribosome maturation factor RimP
LGEKKEMVELISSIEKIVDSYGASIYDIEIVNESGRKIYRVYITRTGGVGLNLCAEISNDISPLLDIYPPIDGEYYFEVSSPGIERKLSKPKHFQNAIDEKVSLKVKDIGRVEGVIKSADDEKITVREESGKTNQYKYYEIDKARTVFDWKSRF